MNKKKRELERLKRLKFQKSIFLVASVIIILSVILVMALDFESSTLFAEVAKNTPDTLGIANANWFSMGFVIGYETAQGPAKLDGISLSVKLGTGVNNYSDWNFSIHAVDVNNHPTGDPLSINSTANMTTWSKASLVWQNVSMPSITLQNGTNYTIVISSHFNEAVGSLNWGRNNTLLNDHGKVFRSTDDGSTWNSYSDGNYTTNFRVYGGATAGTGEVILDSPTNNSILSTIAINFTANYSVSNSFNMTNVTYYIYNSTGDIFNNTLTSIVTGTTNSSTGQIHNFNLGNYEWNVFGCFGNSSFNNCTFASSNFSFTVGAAINDVNYTVEVEETSTQTFVANVTLLNGSEISLAQLIYNGTIYEVSNITLSGDDALLTRTIDIPKNPGLYLNTTNEFLFSFTYTDVGSTTQDTNLFSQNSSFINLQLCNATYNTQAINFTLKDEINQSLINPSANNTNADATFTYWLGGGTKTKNFSFSRPNSATNNSYEICIFPNKPFMVDMDFVYSAKDYDERTYILRNASVTNDTSVINLFLLFDVLATKFTIEVRQGISILNDVVVTVARFFAGEGGFRTISIRETDEVGEFVEYLDLDNDYRYLIAKDGVLLGIINKKATCTESPCEFILQIPEVKGNLYAGLDAHFAKNVLSNLSFDINTKVFTYEFIDITGLAQFFRLRVNQGAYNGTGVEICNEQIFSSSGSMTCNVTGLEGSFVAVGTISRSPEIVDQILETALDLLRDALGLMAVLASFAIILTLCITGGVLSGGNPTMVLGGFGLGILATKLMTILPFSWVLVVLFELIILVIMGWIKT